MTEEITPETFIMPSRLRIMQRLGQISTNNSLREHLFPSIASYEREPMTAEGLVDMLTDRITDYADQYAIGLTVPFLERVPTMINVLVEKEEIKDQSLLYFHEIIMDRKAQADGEDVLARYKKRDMPRRMKKRQATAKRKN